MSVQQCVDQLRASGRSLIAARRIAEAERAKAAAILALDADGVPTFACTLRAGMLRFVCPACGKENRLGPAFGHRIAHCLCWPAGYVLAPAPEGRP